MSSVIVLDSSDEDEAPAKKMHLYRSIATTVASTQPTNAVNKLKAMKQQKTRSIPKSIIVTRHWPAITTSPSTVKELVTKTLLGNATQPIKYYEQSPKSQNQLNKLTKLNIEGTKSSKISKASIQMPMLQPAPHLNLPKCKVPTLQKKLYVNVSSTSGNEPKSPVLPIITSVNSMAPSATPPRQLLATPPHNSSCNNETISTKSIPSHTNNESTLCINNENPVSVVTTNTNSNLTIRLLSRSSNCSNSSDTLSPTVTSQQLPISTSTENRKESIEKPNKLRRVKPITILKPDDEAWLKRSVWSNDDYIDTDNPSPTEYASKKTKLINVDQTTESNPTSVILDLTRAIDDTSTSFPSVNSSQIITSTAEKLNGNRIEEKLVSTVDDVLVLEDNELKVQNSKGVLNKAISLGSEYEKLIRVCREVDASSDMEKLIETKIVKYYYSVHPDFVRSRGFRKNVLEVIKRIQSDPDLVYYHIKTIIDELNIRRKSKSVVLTNEEDDGGGGGGSGVGGSGVDGNGDVCDATVGEINGNKRTHEQIKKLNKALHTLNKRIKKLETCDVDLDDDDSSYLQVERYKKRACQIYDKICDLTGESKNAHRLVKKPIQFKDTSYLEFNKTLQAFINRTKEFPDYFDVLRLLEHCNRTYNYKLMSFEMKRLAHDAFSKVGKLLQSRRKTDLYETVTHFTGNCEDPATSDPVLLAKLSENQKYQTKISAIIEKFAREQDLAVEEHKEARQQDKFVIQSVEGHISTPLHDKKVELIQLKENIDEKLVNGDAFDFNSDKEVTNSKIQNKNKIHIEIGKKDTGSKILKISENSVYTSKIREEIKNKVCDSSADVEKIHIVNNSMRSKTSSDLQVEPEAQQNLSETKDQKWKSQEQYQQQIPNGKYKLNPPIINVLTPSNINNNVTDLSIINNNNNANLLMINSVNLNKTPQTYAKQERTVAEIVISDEEEEGMDS